jgi:hypothetical protein
MLFSTSSAEIHAQTHGVANYSVLISVSDPHWFQCRSRCGSGSKTLGSNGSECGSGSGTRSRVLMTKNLKKFTAEKKFAFFDEKLQFTNP